MDQKRIPLLEQLIGHFENNPISFHVPGHKYGELFSTSGKKYFQELLKLDATELTGLDDLHSPEGVILEAEKLLAHFTGAKKSYFLINGSTVGNLAMIMATVEEHDTVLVQRNCHKSILNGLSLVKADPVFLGPEMDEEWGIAGGVSANTVKQAIKKYPNTKALILTYPNYYGMVNDLEEIIQIAHNKQIPVLIDEAHGAHFQGENFPRSAVHLKADVVVQSAHKTLPAMTMGAYLHFNSNIISERSISKYLQILQSSSPSYPIMASLDIARNYLATYSAEDAMYLLRKIKEFRDGLQKINGIKVLSYNKGIGDPLKITIQSTSMLSGYELQTLLEKEGIFPELADPYNVLLVFPLLKENIDFPTKEMVNRFKAALKSTGATNTVKEKLTFKKPKISKVALHSKEFAKYSKKAVPFNEAIGKISAQLIIPYPPGIPLLFPGEIITYEDIENIKLLQSTGARFQDEGCLKNKKIDIYLT